MTYPTRQWTAEQQDSVNHLQALLALKVLRKQVRNNFTVVNAEADPHGANLLFASRSFVRDAMPGSAPATTTPQHKPVSGERD